MAKYEVYGSIGVVFTYDTDKERVTSVRVADSAAEFRDEYNVWEYTEVGPDGPQWQECDNPTKLMIQRKVNLSNWPSVEEWRE